MGLRIAAHACESYDSGVTRMMTRRVHMCFHLYCSLMSDGMRALALQTCKRVCTHCVFIRVASLSYCACVALFFLHYFWPPRPPAEYTITPYITPPPPAAQTSTIASMPGCDDDGDDGIVPPSFCVFGILDRNPKAMRVTTKMDTYDLCSPCMAQMYDVSVSPKNDGEPQWLDVTCSSDPIMIDFFSLSAFRPMFNSLKRWGRRIYIDTPDAVRLNLPSTWQSKIPLPWVANTCPASLMLNALHDRGFTGSRSIGATHALPLEDQQYKKKRCKQAEKLHVLPLGCRKLTVNRARGFAGCRDREFLPCHVGVRY